MFAGLPVELIYEICSLLGGNGCKTTASTEWFNVIGMHKAQEIHGQVTELFQPLGSSNRLQLLCRVLRTYGH